MSIGVEILQFAPAIIAVGAAVMSVGAWKTSREIAPETLRKDLEVCRKECDRRLDSANGEVARIWRETARSDVMEAEFAGVTKALEAELKAINVRLTRIENLVMERRPTHEAS